MTSIMRSTEATPKAPSAQLGNQPTKFAHTKCPPRWTRRTATLDLTANEPGDWAFHCHLLYHMHAGMMQVVTVRPFPEGESA